MRLVNLLRGLRTRWSSVNLALLRLFLKLVPSESHRVFAVALAAGALCGLSAVSFHLAIIAAENKLIGRAFHSSSARLSTWLIILIPTVGALLCGVILQFIVPGARGSGIPQVKVAYAVRGGRVPLTEAIGKFLVGALQIGSGSSLGREGPTVQICAGIAASLGRLAALSRDNLRRLLPVGAAAGIAAAFNAPIAAVTFTIEEVVGDLDQAVLTWIVVAAAIAAAVERAILGEHPVFTITRNYGLDHASSLLSYAALGLAAAAISLLFTESLLLLRHRFQHLAVIPPWMRPAIGGLLTGILAALALRFLHSEGITGGGYATLSEALSGNIALRALLLLCILKLAATVFSYSSGGAGGLFAPSLFIGGMLGGVFGYIDSVLFHHSSVDVGAFALVGMGAVFAGIVRAPITSVLIIFEMTGSYGLILPLMISNMTAFALARHFRPVPIYEALLQQDRIYLPRRGRVSHALEQLRVGSAMTTKPITLAANALVTDALRQAETDEFSTYPVVDDDAAFIGFVTEARLRRTVAEGGGAQRVSAIVQSSPHVQADDTLVRAVVKMERSGSRQLAVFGPLDGSRLIGLLTMSDVVRAHARAAMDAEDYDRPELPALSAPPRLSEEK
jgi:chloride channel protein, CIC family